MQQFMLPQNYVRGYDNAPYRLIFNVPEDEFRKVMRDIYIATHTTNRPPYFERILSELIEIGMFSRVFLEYAKENPEKFDMSIKRIDELYYWVVEKGVNDESITQELLSFAGYYFCEEFENDIRIFLNDFNYSFLERDYHHQHADEAAIRNSCIIPVW